MWLLTARDPPHLHRGRKVELAVPSRVPPHNRDGGRLLAWGGRGRLGEGCQGLGSWLTEWQLRQHGFQCSLCWLLQLHGAPTSAAMQAVRPPWRGMRRQALRWCLQPRSRHASPPRLRGQQAQRAGHVQRILSGRHYQHAQSFRAGCWAATHACRHMAGTPSEAWCCGLQRCTCHAVGAHNLRLPALRLEIVVDLRRSRRTACPGAWLAGPGKSRQDWDAWAQHACHACTAACLACRTWVAAPQTMTSFTPRPCSSRMSAGGERWQHRQRLWHGC